MALGGNPWLQTQQKPDGTVFRCLFEAAAQMRVQAATQAIAHNGTLAHLAAITTATRQRARSAVDDEVFNAALRFSNSFLAGAVRNTIKVL